MSLDTTTATPAPTRKSLSSSRSTEMKNLFRHTITSTERSAITQYILDAENDIKDYQAEINRLKTTIWTLENKKDALQKSMKRFRFLLSPVYKLPPEILITIFNFCCEMNDLQVKGDSLPMALTLSRVCGRWRDILLSTPRLWRSLSIYFYGWASHQQKLSGLVRMFMTRSEKLGLRIELDFTNGDEKLEVILPALTTLINNSSRWTALKLIVPASVIKHRVFESVRGRLSKLEHLYLTGCGPTEDVEDAHVDLFEDCPSLQSFEYKASSPSIIATVPWHQIQTLKLCNYYSTFAFDRLALCRNAQRLTLHIVGGGREYRSHIVSSVKDLSLTVHEQVDVSSIFQYSTLRELANLEIRGLFDEPDEGYLVWDEAPLQSFLLRSSCSITSLHLQWLPITDEQTASLFLQMPSLTRVHLEEYRTNAGENTIVTPLLLTSLLVDHGCSSVSTPPLLPRLTDMSLVVHQAGLNPDALLKVVTSRWIPDEQYATEVGVGCLKSFSLTVMGKDTLTVGEKLAGLLCFRDAGMRMTLSHLHVAG
ncbi:hypothetical protein AAF712_003740 [Marasmius tenuissimus]|uniref:F-box domain-containing protein n=1 Tax=Marasmius tenuissimus TaxID=585030 RepID=A0ABR3A955_9AGAR|nr:hypothetical protein PM082_017137 [Marasmius tenuissimus]